MGKTTSTPIAVGISCKYAMEITLVHWTERQFLTDSLFSRPDLFIGQLWLDFRFIADSRPRQISTSRLHLLMSDQTSRKYTNSFKRIDDII